VYTLDEQGKGNKIFTNPERDVNASTNLKVQFLPSIFLAVPEANESIFPIAQKLIPLTQLREIILFYAKAIQNSKNYSPAGTLAEISEAK